MMEKSEGKLSTSQLIMIHHEINCRSFLSTRYRSRWFGLGQKSFHATVPFNCIRWETPLPYDSLPA